MSVIVRFAEVAASFDLPPEEALAFFRAKGLRTSFAWQDMMGAEHDAAVTVAKMMDHDLLATVRTSVDRVLADGTTLADFKRELIPALQTAGWWGRKDVVDPLTGRVVSAQLGSASRLETIFRSNLQSAYAAGQWTQIEENAAEAPYLLYDAVDDDRTRPEHRAWDGTVLPVHDKWWKTHYPPNGWRCRCGVIQMSAQDLAEHGLKPKARPPQEYRDWTNPRTGETRLVPKGVDPGWDHNPGLARAERLREVAAEKGARMPVEAIPIGKQLTESINASTVKGMEMRLEWDEDKRRRNLAKHGLDFAAATEVLDSRYRYDVEVDRVGEARLKSIAYAMKFLAVLTVAHTDRAGISRIISFRPASRAERAEYYEWLEDEQDDP